MEGYEEVLSCGGVLDGCDVRWESASLGYY